MKHLIMLIFVVCSLTSLGAYKDGEYYMESKSAIWGWKPFTKIVISEGKILEVVHDRVNKKGELASNDSSYNKDMLKKSGSNPKEYALKIPDNFKKANYILENMDGIAGATDSIEHFKTMAKLLLKKAEEGKPGKYVIKKSVLK